MIFFKNFLIFLFVVSFAVSGLAQVPVTPYLSFNGRYDFLMFGASNNLLGNSTSNDFNCDSSNVSTSSALFTLPATATKIEKAILYWSGSGSGDTHIQFSGPNGLTDRSIDAEKNYVDYVSVLSGTQPYFCASKDITDLLQQYGEGDYTVSELDADSGPKYCNSTVYSGWVIIVIYEDNSLPLNTVKLYDGFQGVSTSTIHFNLNNLEITNPNGGKLGYVVWEGDNLPHLGAEGIQVNGHELSNDINPVGAIFNSTNTYTHSTTNYNMDVDEYDISTFIHTGDQQINIALTSGNDIIFLNTFAITINNELPNASAKIKSLARTCDSRAITLDYTVYNTDANDSLPRNTDISFYALAPGNLLLGTQKTTSPIPIGDSLLQQITLTIPNDLGDQFVLYTVADDAQAVPELNEDNNISTDTIRMAVTYQQIDNQEICEGDTLHWNDHAFVEPVSQDYHFSTIFGCDSLVHLNLAVKKLVELDIDTLICKGETIQLADGSDVQAEGVYPVVLSNQFGCDSTINYHITYKNGDFFTSISGKKLLKLGYSTPLSLNLNFDPDSIFWTPSTQISCDTCPSVMVTPTDETTYTAQVYDPTGCIMTTSHRIQVLKKQEIFVPNIFSPNGDGFNDELRIFTDKDVAAVLELQIYDRWGVQVYDDRHQGDGQSFRWDGTYRGRALPPDVYLYRVVAQFTDGATKAFVGDVAIIR